MTVGEIIEALETVAPLILQEEYDNSGWQIAETSDTVRGVLICLDVTEAVVHEAIAGDFNLIISHHPLLFEGIKSLTGATDVERSLLLAARHKISIYAAHTNLDNAANGVNDRIASLIGLRETTFLRSEGVRNGIEYGSGKVGILEHEEEEESFLLRIKDLFHTGCIKHTAFSGRKIRKVALCGGSGAFLIPEALSCKADIYLTADLKYHNYFTAEDKILLADFGHYESEQFTKELICDIIRKKRSTFAVQLTKLNTNPIKYL